MRELGAGSHSRLAEDVRKVRLDRLGAQKEPRGDVSIRQAGCDESCNLELLRGQLVEGRRVAPTRALTGSASDRATRAPRGTTLRQRAGRPRTEGTRRSHGGGPSVAPRSPGPRAAPPPPRFCLRARAPR